MRILKSSLRTVNLLLSLILIMSGCTTRSDVSSLRKMNFNRGWKFIRVADTLTRCPGVDDPGWKAVQIPHDWSIEEPIAKDNPSGSSGGYYTCGTAFYNKKFRYNHGWKGKNVLITFDGIYMNSEVWINGHYLGKRPYGYIGFTYDLTPYLKRGSNKLLVRVDNSEQPNSRWYTGSGIYRNVWLEVKNKTSVIENGTFVFAQNVSPDSAAITIETRIGHPAFQSGKKVRLISGIYDPSGKKVAEATDETRLDKADTLTIRQEITIRNPALWSPVSPNQYTLVSEIHEDNELLDQYSTRFGIRSTRFDSETGFWLNGKRLKIKGVNMHHDGGPVGAAVPDDVLHRRLVILKKMGCNAIRTSHNPFSPEFYNMCDSMGFLVMDEAFDEWIASWPWQKTKNKGKAKYGYHLYFDDWAAKDFHDFILRDRNHPSVFLWSVGNEIPDQCYPEGVERLKPLLEMVHSLDPSRVVTAGCCFMNLANETGFSDLLDVAGYNGGGGSIFYEKDKVVYSNRKFIATEVPHTFQTRGVYRTKSWMRASRQGIPVPDLTAEEVFPEFSPYYSSSYDNCSVRLSARDSWRRTDSLDFVSGEFRWTGFDYLGESNNGWPARFWNFGVIDVCGFPKDTYYFYQSRWTKDPMVHVLPHWTWPGKEGMVIPVWCYSNCDDVELFLNGTSLGQQSMKDRMHLAWNVPYSPGELKAIGKIKGKVVAEDVVKTASEPARIQVIPDKEIIQANGVSCAQLEVNILDRDGNSVPWANNLVSFRIEGPAKNIGFDNGDPLDLSSTKIDSRKAFNGKCLLILQSTGKTGTVKVEVSSPGLKSVVQEIAAVKND